MHQHSMMRAAVGCALLVMASGIGCTTGNPPPGDSAYQQGLLDNGGFVFSCQDGVACSSFSTGYAKDFPKNGVAIGSTFSILYVPNDDQDQPATSTPSDAIGITVRGLTPFFNGVPTGAITANTQEGYGAIVAERADGVLVDFISIQIVKPASITIYDADTVGDTAQDVGAAYTLPLATMHQFRAVAEDAGHNILAGSLNSQWASSDPTIFSIATDNGLTTITGLKAGSANLTLTSASFTRTLAVTVSP